MEKNIIQKIYLANRILYEHLYKVDLMKIHNENLIFFNCILR